MEPCRYGEGEGYYDDVERRNFGIMLHGITYADEAYDENTAGHMTVRFSETIMKNGVIEYKRPEDCTLNRVISKMQIKEFGAQEFSGLEEFEMGGELLELDNEIM